MTGVNKDQTAHFECTRKLEEGQNCAHDNWCISGRCSDEGKCLEDYRVFESFEDDAAYE